MPPIVLDLPGYQFIANEYEWPFAMQKELCLFQMLCVAAIAVCQNSLTSVETTLVVDIQCLMSRFMHLCRSSGVLCRKSARADVTSADLPKPTDQMPIRIEKKVYYVAYHWPGKPQVVCM